MTPHPYAVSILLKHAGELRAKARAARPPQSASERFKFNQLCKVDELERKVTELRDAICRLEAV